MNFKLIRVRDLILVNDRGEVVDGNWPVNAAAFAIHSQIHAARPDVVAAAHAHSVYGKAWSSLRRQLDPLTQGSCAFYGDHGLYGDYTGAVLDLEEGKRIASAPGGNKAVILSNHGLLTVGQTSVDEAAWWFITMERTCQAQLLAEAAGSPVLIDAHYAEKTAGQAGPPMAGWRAFQPLYEWIVKASGPSMRRSCVWKRGRRPLPMHRASSERGCPTVRTSPLRSGGLPTSDRRDGRAPRALGGRRPAAGSSGARDQARNPL